MGDLSLEEIVDPDWNDWTFDQTDEELLSHFQLSRQSARGAKRAREEAAVEGASGF